MKQPVFVLGDSRTGTTSLHRYFMDSGLWSIHYFVDEVSQIAAEDGFDRHYYEHFRKFVETSDYNAFSDYPTRNYFRELLRDYPDALFILSVRKDTEAWRGSMKRFFKDDDEVLRSLPRLTTLHSQINDEIRRTYAAAASFIEVNIDDGNEKNSAVLSDFLGLRENLPLQRLNATRPKRPQSL